MKQRRVDVAVIGAGTAGLVARRAAEKRGAKVVMIEDGPYGTMCARVGCMPSKLLIAAADLAHDIDRSEIFGVRASAVEVDGAAVLRRVRRERDRFVDFVVDSVDALPEEQKIHGRARFLSPTVLEIDDHTRLETKAVVIATGSSPWIPDSLAAVRDRVLVNDDVFELEVLPASAAVVGTGVIGLELGQALSRLGVRVSFFSHTDGLGHPTDPEVRRVVHDVFSGELDLHLGVELASERVADGCRLRWRDGKGAEMDATFEVVVAATGRRPNLSGLGLENCGIAVDARGVPKFDRRTMQCSAAPIFIAGDADGDRSLLHEASDEGHIAGANAASFPQVRAHIRRVPLSVTFTDPQMAVVGTAYADLDHDEVSVGEVDYGKQGRARVMAKNAGIVRIYARNDCGTLVGAEMFGPRVEHTAHLLAWAVQSRMSVERALEMPFYHPVVEEGIRSALHDLAGVLKLREEARPLDLECGPGV